MLFDDDFVTIHRGIDRDIFDLRDRRTASGDAFHPSCPVDAPRCPGNQRDFTARARHARDATRVASVFLPHLPGFRDPPAG